jgi:hypothetical protein
MNGRRIFTPGNGSSMRVIGLRETWKVKMGLQQMSQTYAKGENAIIIGFFSVDSPDSRHENSLLF